MVTTTRSSRSSLRVGTQLSNVFSITMFFDPNGRLLSSGDDGNLILAKPIEGLRHLFVGCAHRGQVLHESLKLEALQDHYDDQSLEAACEFILSIEIIYQILMY